MSFKDKLAQIKAKSNPAPAATVTKKAATTTKPKAVKAAKAPKAEKRKKAISFEMPKSNSNKLSKGFENLTALNDSFAESLNLFLEGKRSASTESRAKLQEIIVLCKAMRNDITEAKTALKPIYAS
jgi:hypothetical protein